MGTPNLLLITTDQQRWDTIARMGAAGVWTPHMDWLADTGISFTDAMTDCPVCGPARSTIMTGLHAWRHGETQNRSTPSPMAEHPTLPGLLSQVGYQTRAVGKMHFNPTRAHYGFQHMEILPDYYRWMLSQGGAPPKAHGIGENEMAPGWATVPDHLTVTSWTVDRSIEFLHTRDTTRPFFLWTSFSKPHPPFDPPMSCWSMIDADELPDPVIADWAREVGPETDAWREPTYHLNNCHRFSQAQMRAIRRAYAACILHVDQQMGRLFAHMREMGLLANTWVAFTSDHGEMLGDQRMGGKSVFFPGSRRVPLIVRPPAPGHLADERAGSRDDRLACLADLLPTFLALAGGDLPPVDGLDLLGPAQRDHLIGECIGYHAVVTKDETLHFTERGGKTLAFDRLNESGQAPKGASGLIDILGASLDARQHRAAGLKATMPVLTESEAVRRIWPGFHTIHDDTCDLLH